MQDEPEGRGQLGRREFVKRSVMAAAAAAAAGPLMGAERLTRIAKAHGGIPPLRAPGRIAGLAVRRDGLVAVGAHGEAPFVWMYTFGAGGWVHAAGASAFPAETGLSSVAAVGDTLYAAGSITAHIDAGTIHVHDEAELGPPRPVRAGDVSGHAGPHPAARPLQLDAHLVTPAIFSSVDGANWEIVLNGVSGIPMGGLNAIATLEGSRVIAVGPRFPELDVEEPSGIFGVVSAGGRSWNTIGLDGVAPPQHGDITLLAEVGDQLLLGTTGTDGAALYVASRSAPFLTGAARLPEEVPSSVRLPSWLDSWRRIESPAVEGPVSFLAAGPVAGGILLAGVDHLDEPRFWELRGGAWREIGPPVNLGPQSRLQDLEVVDGSLMAGGSDGDQTLVAKVRG